MLNMLQDKAKSEIVLDPLFINLSLLFFVFFCFSLKVSVLHLFSFIQTFFPSPYNNNQIKDEPFSILH